MKLKEVRFPKGSGVTIRTADRVRAVSRLTADENTSIEVTPLGLLVRQKGVAPQWIPTASSCGGVVDEASLAKPSGAKGNG